jgi:predicted nuclease of predicted toxin-antitoxin system
MRLLFDQNLSHKLVGHLADVFPDSEHVRNLGMESATDPEIARYALAEGFAIVSKDADFLETLADDPSQVIEIL